MAKYFNRGRGNLPLSLPGGQSVTVPGNSWIELAGPQETCAAVIRALAKGQLFRRAPRPEVQQSTIEVKTEAPGASAPQVVAEEETLAASAAVEPKPQTAEDQDGGFKSSFRKRSSIR